VYAVDMMRHAEAAFPVLLALPSVAANPDKIPLLSMLEGHRLTRHLGSCTACIAYLSENVSLKGLTVACHFPAVSSYNFSALMIFHPSI
jgi:hypothetical protein